MTPEPAAYALWAAAALTAPRHAEVELSVVVPVRNEAPNVQPLVQEIVDALNGRRFEIVYVDDGSTDATAGELAAACRDHPQLRVVRHSTPTGQSAALRTGILAARAPLVATLDGDGQNDPADLPALLAFFTANEAPAELGLVGGDRSRNRQDSWIKRRSSRIANAVRSRMLRDATPDSGCGLKVFRRDAYLLLPFFDHQHRFLPALFLREGFAVRSVAVGHRPRLGGRSNYGTLDRLAVGIVDLFGVGWLRRRKRPMPAIEGN
ncbi:MAG: glycosyltransferase family 2 protein [Geminicoccaceae bacterium]|nr:MAG: glycosyltransferase family 2 protein [Geminicoccaceae bacterium]